MTLKLFQSISSPPFLLGGQSLVPNFEKGGSEKLSARRVLKSLCHRYLPGKWRGGGGVGGYSMFLLKKIMSKAKYGFEDLIFQCQFWPVLAKQPINVLFCDILVLLNHLNNVARN